MKRVYWLILIASLALHYRAVMAQTPDPSQAPEILSLERAKEIAIKNHPKVSESLLDALAANQVVIQTRSVYFPQVYGNATGVIAASNSRIAAGGLNNPIIFNRYSNGVIGSQFITDFGRTYNLVKSSQLHSEAQWANVEATRQQILLQLTQAYYATLQSQGILKVAKETVTQRQLIVDQVTALAKSQLRSELDVSFAKVSLEQAQLLLIQAQNDLDGSFARLSAALGYQRERVFQLVEEPMPGPPPPDISPLIDEAFRQRPDLASLTLERDSAQRFATAERDRWFPTLSAIGAAGLTPLHADQLSDRYAAAGVNISIPIFNGGLFGALRREANLKAQADEQRQRDLMNHISRDMRIAWLDLNTAFKRLDVTAQLLEQAKLALDLAQGRYKLGLGSIIELTQAQLNLTQAEVDNTTARYNYQLQSAVLDYQTGTLH
jgi:outer membrane protein